MNDVYGGTKTIPDCKLRRRVGNAIAKSFCQCDALVNDTDDLALERTLVHGFY